MIQVQETFTNEEAAALEDAMQRVERDLRKRLQVDAMSPADPAPLAWSAWRKLTRAIREHVTTLRKGA
jgi:hypothetical protein